MVTCLRMSGNPCWSSLSTTWEQFVYRGGARARVRPRHRCTRSTRWYSADDRALAWSYGRPDLPQKWTARLGLTNQEYHWRHEYPHAASGGSGCCFKCVVLFPSGAACTGEHRRSCVRERGRWLDRLVIHLLTTAAATSNCREVRASYKTNTTVGFRRYQTGARPLLVRPGKISRFASDARVQEFSSSSPSRCPAFDHGPAR